MVADPPDSPVFLSVDDEDVDIDGAGARADQSESASEEQEPNGTMGATLESTLEVTHDMMEEKDTVEKENSQQEHHEMVNDPIQMGLEPVQMGPQTEQTDTDTVQMDMEPFQTDIEPTDSAARLFQTLQLVQIGGEVDHFDFESPPRSRGRPKAKPSVVKAKQSRAVAMADYDSTLHSMHLSLATVAEIVAGNPTYLSDASTLKRFKLFVFEKKTKPPVEKAMTWIPTVHVSLPVVCHFRAHEDPSMTDKMESLRLLSSEVEVLDLAATGCLSDNTMTTLMAKKFAPDPTRIVGSANLVNVILGNNFAVDHAGVKTLFFSASAEHVMIPVNCNGNHWCSIMIDFAEQKLFYYDPMESTYKLGLRAAAQSIKSIVPGW
ncbi:hypothetical protein PF010_g4261 [Phytophthora fragariae]|uniref:Ubiquitin-like protease family profile domain-containing protein n=1 Tax=Phytophthora fragariae TaxID=53985 RepID=A0A6A4A737_9STRA|nr:hypothetical protein PF003_g18693 [Phytophthora fragariae]KAE9129101.1 hypothetical protein PF010_g4261 [Phytophthora fragariae]KAE9248149.1 hypothetical protein PF002_g5921 [Phytophthora fragariae]